MRILIQKARENGIVLNMRNAERRERHSIARLAAYGASVLLCGTLAVLCAACGTVMAKPPSDVSGADHDAETRLPPAKDAGIDSGLDAAVFRQLPPPVTGYLASIAAAIQRHDEEFLLAQGEESFTDWANTALKNNETILGYLFRTGNLAVDTPQAAAHEPRLALREVRGITYQAWAERGPFIEVRAVVRTGGGEIPARLLVIWKFDEPKLQGYME
jgi:hypothetical protein